MWEEVSQQEGIGVRIRLPPPPPTRFTCKGIYKKGSWLVEETWEQQVELTVTFNV